MDEGISSQIRWSSMVSLLYPGHIVVFSTIVLRSKIVCYEIAYIDAPKTFTHLDKMFSENVKYISEICVLIFNYVKLELLKFE